MPGHDSLPAIMLVIPFYMLLTSFVVSPSSPLGLWDVLTGKYVSYKTRRQEKRCRDAREKLKKYWVIEMKKLH